MQKIVNKANQAKNKQPELSKTAPSKANQANQTKQCTNQSKPSKATPSTLIFARAILAQAFGLEHLSYFWRDQQWQPSSEDQACCATSWLTASNYCRSLWIVTGHSYFTAFRDRSRELTTFVFATTANKLGLFLAWAKIGAPIFNVLFRRPVVCFLRLLSTRHMESLDAQTIEDSCNLDGNELKEPNSQTSVEKACSFEPASSGSNFGEPVYPVARYMDDK